MDELVQQIGLLLTQLRVARRALEDIERSTSRYNSFAFAAALSQGAQFGAPPMFSGALKVWVTNINDLAPGAGGGLLEQLLGGVGRLIGGIGSGFAAGALGGIFGGWNLPAMVSQIQKAADSIDRILTKLGIDFSKKEEAPGSPGLIQTLQGLSDDFNTFTALFLAGTGKTGEAQKASDATGEGAQRWLAIVQATSALMERIDRVVQGLILLIPIAVGALADVVFRLDTIKLGIVELLQFLLREVLLLRGVLLATIFDTLSAAAKLGSTTFGLLSVAMGSIATSIFQIFSHIFQAAVATIKFLSDGLQNTIDTLARWLVNVISSALFSIGQSLVFKEIVHIVRILPDIIPPLVLAIRGSDAAKTVNTSALNDARKATADALAILGAGPPSTPPGAGLLAPPSIPSALLPDDAVNKFAAKINESVGGVKTEIKNVFGAATSALDVLSKTLDDAAKDKTFTDTLRGHIDKVRSNSDELARAFAKAEEQKAGHPATGLETIADAYEKWLAGKGLEDLLSNVDQYFKRAGAVDTLRDKVIGPTTIDRPRATVDIQDVIIELEPASEAPSATSMSVAPGTTTGVTPEEMLQQVAELLHELSERGHTFGAGSPITQV
jgi:hypothetical protein